MAKVFSLFVIVAGTASVCTAYVMHSSSATLKGPGSRNSAPVVAPGETRDYLRHSATLVEPSEDQSAPVVVTIVKRNITPPGISASTVAAGLPTPVLGDRTSLVRELQRELRRVGCYDGALNESWTLATRTAMKSFTNRINAVLPIDKPDQVLLTLVQGYRDRVCGVPCPPGESLGRDGVCISNAILARATRKAPQDRATLAVTEQRRDIVVRSTVTPPDPAIGDLANDGVARPEAGITGAKTARVRAPQRQRRRNFAGGFFGLFGW